MRDEPVILRIAEARTGRSARLLVPRWRAEAIAAEGLASWPHHEFAINPPEDVDVEEPKIVEGTADAAAAAAVVAAPPLGKALAALAFVAAHRGPIAALAVLLLLGLLAVLAIHLPQAQYRVYPVAILALVSFCIGFFSPRPTLPNL